MVVLTDLRLDHDGYLSAMIDGDRFDLGRVQLLEPPKAHHGTGWPEGPVTCMESTVRMGPAFRRWLTAAFTPRMGS
jgi:hypothetical protein